MERQDNVEIVVKLCDSLLNKERPIIATQRLYIEERR